MVEEEKAGAGLLGAACFLSQELESPLSLDVQTKEQLHQLQRRLALLLEEPKNGQKKIANGTTAAPSLKRSRSAGSLQYSLSKLPNSVMTHIASYVVWADHPGFYEKDAWGPFRKMVLLSRDLRAAATSNILWRPACLRRWPWVEADDEAVRYVRNSIPDQRWFNMFVIMRRTAAGMDRGYRFNWVSDIELNIHMVDIKKAVNLCSVPGPLTIDHSWTRAPDSFFCSFHPVLGDDKGHYTDKLLSLMSLPADKLYSADEDGQSEPSSQLSEYLTWAWSTTQLRVEVRALDRVTGSVATLFGSECLEDRLLSIEPAPRRESDPASLHSRFTVGTGVLPLGDPRFFVRFSFDVSLLLPGGSTASAPPPTQAATAALGPVSPGRPLTQAREAAKGEDMQVCEPGVVVFDGFAVECGVSDPQLCQPRMTSSRLAFALVQSLAWTGVGAKSSFVR